MLSLRLLRLVRRPSDRTFRLQIGTSESNFDVFLAEKAWEDMARAGPVTIGVDYHDGHPGNNDKMTDHFILAIGYTQNLRSGVTTYRFFDPAVPDDDKQQRGISPNNTINNEGGQLTGRLPWTMKQRYPFTVTQIRTNKN